MSCPFSIEITLDVTGVRSVRVLGEGWDQGRGAHALLQRLSRLIHQLDTEAKRDATPGLGKGGQGIQ
jgi:hypothetical protein